MANSRNSSPTSTAEQNLFLDILNDAPLAAHRKPTKIYGSIFYSFLLAGYATVGIAAPWIFEALDPWISQLLCSCNVILLIITGIFLQYLVHQVQKIRLQGYYMFSQRLKHIVRLPFSTISYGLLKSSRPPSVSRLIVFIEDKLPWSDETCEACWGTAGMLLLVVWEPKISFLSASGLLRIVMLVEVVIAGTFMAIYIGTLYFYFCITVIFSLRVKSEHGYVHQYNSLDSQPDVLKSLYSPLQQSSSLEGLRYYDGRFADQQMALLQYQRENIHFLCEEILRLQECLSKYETSSGGIAPQVDLAHLLAARDQELRTLSAEMDHLQSELQHARSLIAENDAESHRIRVTNNQYIEENERLRAILGEWSTRAAKLERALEAERVLNLDLQKNIMRLKDRSSEVVEPSQKD